MSHNSDLTCSLRGLFILFAMVLVSSFVSAQDLILNGNQTNNGTIRVRRDVINNTTGAVTVSGSGVVRLDRNTGPISSAHVIRSASGTYPITFSNLDMINNQPTTCQVDVTVTNNFRLGNGATAYTAAGAGFDIGARTLTISNLSSYMATSTAALTLNNGTVVYNSGASQVVLNKASGVAYGTLTLSGAGAKSVPAGGTVTAAALGQTGGQLTVEENIDVTGSGSFADLGAISAAKRLRIAAGATAGSVTAMNNSGTGIFENAANIGVIVTTLSGNAGTIQNTGTGSLAFANAASSNGTISNTSTGTIDFNNDLTGTGTILQSAAGTIEVGGAFTQNTYTINNGTVLYNGTAAGQSIVGTAYSNVTLNNGSKILAAASTISGNLTLDGSSALDLNGNNVSVGGSLALGSTITTGAGVLTLTSTNASNVSGSGEVLGAVRRNHDFAAGSNYMFNRPDVYVGTAARAASDITLRVAPATDPAAPLASANYVRRNYAITAPSAGNVQSIRLYYAAGELQGSLITDDTKIGLRTYSGGAWSKVTNAGQVRTSGGGNTYMTYSGLNNAFPASGELGMFKTSFVTAANGANISLAAGWDENALPSSSDDATINHTGVVTGAGAVSVASMTINAGSSLLMDGAGSLTVAAATQIDGSLAVNSANADIAAITLGTNGTVTVANGRTLTGTSLTNNSGVASTFAGNVTLGSLTNSGTGALNFNGSSSTISGAVSNADGAAMNINGTLHLMTSAPLSLSSSGNISILGAAGILNIGQAGTTSNLTMAGNSTLSINNAAGQLNVFGNLEIGSTATLDNAGTITVGE